jgi:excisionase family DNA binding protein
MQLLCLRMVETAGATLVLGRNVMPALLIARARARRTKVSERAASSHQGKPRQRPEARGKPRQKRRKLLLQQSPETGSFADVTMTAEEPDLRPVKEAADHFGVSSRSIYNWVKAGQLTDYKTLGGGRRFVDMNELRRKLKS